MDRTERLLDLVALLLDATEPISWAELREAFPEDYGAGSDEAAERKFERDKAELLELGIPIGYVQGDDERRDGYLVERDAYYLPEVGLTKEELAVLYAAGSAALASGAFPGRQDLAHALRKIGFFEGAEVPTPRVRVELSAAREGGELAPKLELLWGAAAARKWVEMSYWSPKRGEVTARKVDPYGLALRQGVWSLVGYCHLRQGIRTFQVHRIRELKVNPSRPRTPDFEVSKGFRLDDYVASYPWQPLIHAKMKVEAELSGELVTMAPRLFPPEAVRVAGERAQVTLEVTYLEGLLRYLLSLGTTCKVRSPPEAVAAFREMTERVYAAHVGAGSEP